MNLRKFFGMFKARKSVFVSVDDVKIAINPGPLLEEYHDLLDLEALRDEMRAPGYAELKAQLAELEARYSEQCRGSGEIIARLEGTRKDLEKRIRDQRQTIERITEDFDRHRKATSGKADENRRLEVENRALVRRVAELESTQTEFQRVNCGIANDLTAANLKAHSLAQRLNTPDPLRVALRQLIRAAIDPRSEAK